MYKHLSFRTKSALLFFLSLWMSAGHAFVRPSRRSVRRSASPTSRITLLGDFDIAQQDARTADSLPPFHLYFHGTHTTSDNSGRYSFAIDKEDHGVLGSLSLIICKRLELEFEQGTTLKGIKLAKLGKCRWFNLVREKKRVDGEEKYYWDYEERAVQENDVLPENAIVLLLSDARVVGIEKTEQQTYIPDEHDSRKSKMYDLPRIILENDMPKLKRASVKSAIEGIELRRLTEDKTPRTKTQNGVETALVA